MDKTFFVVQHVPHEDLGSWTPLFQKHKIQLQWIRPFNGETVPKQINCADGLIVMGGPMGVYEQDQFPYLTRELHLIQSALENNIPTIGVCLGSQLLAEASGGKVYKGHQKEIGWFKANLTKGGQKDVAFSRFPNEFDVFQWHGDTFDLPKHALRLVESETYPNQAFRVGKNAWGLQFHIEMTASLIHSWLKEGEQEIAPLGGKTLADQILKQTPESLPVLQNRGEQFFNNFIEGE